MIHDELTEFLDATALNTGGAGTYLIGDVIDLGASGGTLKDIGNGRSLYWVVQISTTATSGGSATGNLQLASDAQAAIATDGSATVHAQTGAIAVATLVAGYRRVFPLPVEKRYERYVGVLQVTATAAFTAGAVDSFLTLDPPGWYAAPDGTN
jgi:hypothetical protein